MNNFFLSPPPPPRAVKLSPIIRGHRFDPVFSLLSPLREDNPSYFVITYGVSCELSRLCPHATVLTIADKTLIS
jgi:hypothetical protein